VELIPFWLLSEHSILKINHRFAHVSVAENFFPEMVSLACANDIPTFFFD